VNIVHADSEVFPFVKTGGLADVVAALSKALASYGHNVSVFLPGYRAALEHHAASGTEKVLSIQVEMGGVFHRGHVRKLVVPRGPTVYFICKDEYFDRRHAYGTSESDYEDNAERFIFFSRAVVESMRLLKLNVDVVHCHDWQTGLLPLFLRSEERKHRVTLAIRTVFTIHNIAFQGIFPMSTFGLTGLPDDLLGIDVKWFVYRQLPRETETIILWARDDLFPDARENVQQ
jgi:starch synthase